jgi:hypothetical protein
MKYGKRILITMALMRRVTMPKYEIELVKRTVTKVIIEAASEAYAIDMIQPMLKQNVSWQTPRKVEETGHEPMLEWAKGVKG